MPHDAHETAFNEGRRAVVLDILAALRTSEAHLEKLNQETTIDE